MTSQNCGLVDIGTGGGGAPSLSVGVVPTGLDNAGFFFGGGGAGFFFPKTDAAADRPGVLGVAEDELGGRLSTLPPAP